MPNSKILIGALLLTNAVAGVMWWRSHSQAQYWQAEARASSKQYDIASKENNLLQEAIINEKGTQLKFFALNNTSLGKCISEHLENARNYCVGPERVIKGYQKSLNRSGSIYKVGSLLRKIKENEALEAPESSQKLTDSSEIFQLLESSKGEREFISHEKKRDEVCSGREGAETSTQCVLYKNLQNK
jgi:hypothetical protein